jgi:aspartyl/asparaginyl-tRNA synthetase
MFRVTTLPDEKISRDAEDFFGKRAFLTVSGQLEGETFACALSNIYTFGPTFRAENSNTSRHTAEFWMIEPEMAFCDLAGDMDLAITIRTGVVKGNVLYVQAGAGIVADSVPEMEWRETEAKARAVLRAAEQVEDGFDGE